MPIKDKKLERKHRSTTLHPHAASQGAEVRATTVYNQLAAQKDVDAYKAEGEEEVIITKTTVIDSKILQDSRLRSTTR